MRLKNSNFAIFREATIDVNINGLFIFNVILLKLKLKFSYLISTFMLSFNLLKKCKKIHLLYIFIFLGYIIPKGWKVLTWARAIHMDPTYYPNPYEFNPSRWNVSSIIMS